MKRAALLYFVPNDFYLTIKKMSTYDEEKQEWQVPPPTPDVAAACQGRAGGAAGASGIAEE